MMNPRDETSRRPAGTRFVQAVLAADRDAIEAELADEVGFNSPIRRYTRRADVAHLLALIGEILPQARIERSWRDERGAATVIAATLDEGRLDGVVEELHDRDGRVREVTLMLRPHSAMMPAIRRMAAALEVSPLPAGGAARVGAAQRVDRRERSGTADADGCLVLASRSRRHR
jgi:hypothetical protein